MTTTKGLVNVDHITDVAVSVFNGKTLVGLSTILTERTIMKSTKHLNKLEF